MNKQILKKCVICKKEFVPQQKTQKYCQSECSYKAIKIKAKERYDKRPLSRMIIKLQGDRLWLDITDIYQFAKKVNK